jgi:hypothetical protein
LRKKKIKNHRFSSSYSPREALLPLDLRRTQVIANTITKKTRATAPKIDPMAIFSSTWEVVGVVAVGGVVEVAVGEPVEVVVLVGTSVVVEDTPRVVEVF